MSKFKLLDRVVVNNCDEVLTVVEVNVNHRISTWGGQVEFFTSNGSVTSLGRPYNNSTPNYKLSSFGGATIIANENDITLVGCARKQVKYDLLKMYVLVKNTAPIGLGINAVGHATFMAAQRFTSDIFKEWNENSFRKVTCLVSPEEFDMAIGAINEVDGKYVVFNENDWNDQDLSVAFEPRYSFPEIFKTFKLHSGSV